MTIFLLKSILALLMLLPAAYGIYTISAAFGRTADAELVGRYKRHHHIAGYIFIGLFLLVSWLCISFSAAARTEPSPRASLHILLALAVAVLFIMKVLYIRKFRQYYDQAKTFGTALSILTIVLVGISAGYFLTVSRFGQDRTMDRSAGYTLRGPFFTVTEIAGRDSEAVRTDRRSIERGHTLFQSRCAACHDPASTRTIMGPGLQGLLKGPKLPVSGHPATAESIRFQLRQPMGRMPSFAYLSHDEMEDLIAYLNTL